MVRWMDRLYLHPFHLVPSMFGTTDGSSQPRAALLAVKELKAANAELLRRYKGICLGRFFA